jgi:hypothetical protein
LLEEVPPFLAADKVLQAHNGILNAVGQPSTAQRHALLFCSEYFFCIGSARRNPLDGRILAKDARLHIVNRRWRGFSLQCCS